MGLRLVSDDGEVVSADEADIGARILELEQDLVNVEKALRSERRLRKKAETDRDKERASYPERETVSKLFEYWVMKTGHKRSKLTPDRFDCLKNALEQGYTPKQIALAIAGGAYDPWITQNKNGRAERHDDLTLVLRDGKHIESYARKAPKKAQSQTQTEPHEGSGDPL